MSKASVTVSVHPPDGQVNVQAGGPTNVVGVPVLGTQIGAVGSAGKHPCVIMGPKVVNSNQVPSVDTGVGPCVVTYSSGVEIIPPSNNNGWAADSASGIENGIENTPITINAKNPNNTFGSNFPILSPK